MKLLRIYNINGFTVPYLTYPRKTGPLLDIVYNTEGTKDKGVPNGNEKAFNRTDSIHLEAV